MGRPTVAARFGEETADRLARIAIDLLCEAPEKITTSTTKVPASEIERGREILDDAGIDWRVLIRDRVARERQAADQLLAERLGREAAKRDTESLRRLLDRLPADSAAQRRAIETELARRAD